MLKASVVAKFLHKIPLIGPDSFLFNIKNILVLVVFASSNSPNLVWLQNGIFNLIYLVYPSLTSDPKAQK